MLDEVRNYQDKTVVVTGGTGFIGKNLVYALAEGGAHVVVIARQAKRTFADMPVTTIDGDLQSTVLMEVLNSNKVSPHFIFHLAAVSGGIHYLQQIPGTVLQTNLAITSNSFRHLEQLTELEGQLFLSSVCAYPQEYQVDEDADGIWLSESLVPVNNPDSAYGWSKIMGEMLVALYHREFGTPGVSIRLFNTYGPHENLDPRRTHVVPALMVRALRFDRTGTFEVLGDGNQIRSFLYIEDTIRALLRAAWRIKNGEILNVGSDTKTSIRQLVDAVIDVSGQSIQPVYKPTQSVGARGRLPVIEKAKRLLDWKPVTSLSAGLAKTYAWARSQNFG